MKKIVFTLFILLFVGIAYADYRYTWNLQDSTGVDIDGYVIYYTDDNDVYKYRYIISDPSTNSIPLKTLGINPGVRYEYRICTYKGECISDLSPATEFTYPGFDVSIGNKLPENTIVIYAPTGTVIVSVNTDNGVN